MVRNREETLDLTTSRRMIKSLQNSTHEFMQTV